MGQADCISGSTFKRLVGTAQEGAGLTFEIWHPSTENRAGPGILRAFARKYGPAPSCGQAHYQQNKFAPVSHHLRPPLACFASAPSRHRLGEDGKETPSSRVPQQCSEETVNTKWECPHIRPSGKVPWILIGTKGGTLPHFPDCFLSAQEYVLTCLQIGTIMVSRRRPQWRRSR